ncbi:MAG: hypothetical protein SGPRY_008478 [Prymnesium sp.]
MYENLFPPTTHEASINPPPGTEERPWAWAFRQLARRRADVNTHLSARVVETVLFDGGEPSLWIFTSRDGEVLRRNADKLRLELVSERFCGSGPPTSRSSPYEPYATAVRRGVATGSRLHALILTESESYRMLRAPDEKSSVVAMQAFVQGASRSGSRFRCRVRIEGAARRPSTSVHKRLYTEGAADGFACVHPRSPGMFSRVSGSVEHKSHMSAFNAALGHITLGLLRHIEAVSQLQVVQLVADFVTDDNSQPWLVSMPEVLTKLPSKKAAARPASAAERLTSQGSESELLRPASAAAFLRHREQAHDDPFGGGRPKPWLRLHPSLSKCPEVQQKLIARGEAAECAGDYCWVRPRPFPQLSPKGQLDTSHGNVNRAEGTRAKALPATTIGRARFIVPYKVALSHVCRFASQSILLARVEKAIPLAKSMGERELLLGSGQPGSTHPSQPEKPRPFEFYSSGLCPTCLNSPLDPSPSLTCWLDAAWVCDHCYVTYSRLDKVRHQTLPPQVKGSDELKSCVPSSSPSKRERPGFVNAVHEWLALTDAALGRLPRKTASASKRLVVSHKQLDRK